jgi:hypothetical protein
VTGSAGRPNGSNGAPDGRSEREPESASFEIARVPSRRGSSPIFILGFLVIVGAIVAVGAGVGSSGQPSLPPIALGSPVASLATVQATPTPEPSAEPTIPPATPPPSPGRVQTVYSGEGPIELQARRLSGSVYIHGDVYVPQVTWVFVSLQDDAGRVAGWSSVSVPGAAGPARDKGPTLRFDVDLAVPIGFGGRLWLHANAYDSEGALMTSARVEIGPAPA